MNEIIDDRQKKSPEERIFRLEQQTIVLDDIDCQGYILDLGGGGTAVIGLLKGEQVISILPPRKEKESTIPGHLRMIMEAHDLKFLNNSFNLVTAFFAFMYINQSHHETVFSEIYRVLKPGGELMIWDVVLPERPDPHKDIYVVLVRVTLPGQEINTGYGQFWPNQARDEAYYQNLAEKTGFDVLEQKTEGRVMVLKLGKPRAVVGI